MGILWKKGRCYHCCMSKIYKQGASFLCSTLLVLKLTVLLSVEKHHPWMTVSPVCCLSLTSQYKLFNRQKLHHTGTKMCVVHLKIKIRIWKVYWSHNKLVLVLRKKTKLAPISVVQENAKFKIQFKHKYAEIMIRCSIVCPFVSHENYSTAQKVPDFPVFFLPAHLSRIGIWNDVFLFDFNALNTNLKVLFVANK